LALELLVAVYFIVAIRLLFAGALAGLRLTAQALEGRLYGRTLVLQPRSWGRTLLRMMPVVLLLAVGVPYFLAAVYVHRFKVPEANPQTAEPERQFENVTFVTGDGVTIRGWFIQAVRPEARRTVIICHGLGSNCSYFLPYLAVSDALEAHVLLFDFRGHGASGGHTISFGYREKLDVAAAIDHVRTRRPQQAQEVIGLGVSMGTAALIEAAAEVEPALDGVIIDSGFASAGDLVDGVLGDFPELVRPWLSGLGVPLASLHAGCWLPGIRPIDHVHQLRAPVLFIHSQGDRLLPPEQAQHLFQHAAEPKTLWIADTEGHASVLILAREEYLQRVQLWGTPLVRARGR
jgi:pimeloyl-ACP methyl ester carboxylesterase